MSFGVTDISLFMSGSIMLWAMPIGALEVTAMEVDANLGWILEDLRDDFELDYQGQVEQMEGEMGP